MTDVQKVWNGFVYFASLWMLGVSPWKSGIVGIIVFLSTYTHYGARWLLRGGVVLMLVAIVTWIGAVPAPSQWHNAISYFRQIATAPN